MINVDKKNILLVEDEALISLVGKKTLERNGFEVETATSGENALEMRFPVLQNVRVQQNRVAGLAHPGPGCK